MFDRNECLQVIAEVEKKLLGRALCSLLAPFGFMNRYRFVL